MVSLPTVSLFCGCCDLKVANTVIASLRIIGSIAIACYSILLLFIFDEVEESAEESGVEISKLNIFVSTISCIVLLFQSVVSIWFSYWFIRSIISNNPTKMKYYVYMDGVIVIVTCIVGICTFRISYIAIAAVEFYLFICANSLYKTYMETFREDPVIEQQTAITGNAHEQPPSYNSSEYEKKDTN